MPNYWENRQGTAAAPIIIQSARGASSVRLSNMNVFNVDHLALIDVRLDSPNDVFHCEQCTYLLLRRSVFNGIGDPTSRKGRKKESRLTSLPTRLSKTPRSPAGRTTHSILSRFTAVTSGETQSVGRKTGADMSKEDPTTYLLRQTPSTSVEPAALPWDRARALSLWMLRISSTRPTTSQSSTMSHTTRLARALASMAAQITPVAHNTTWRTGTRSHILEASFGERSCDGDVTGCTSRIAAGDGGQQGLWKTRSTFPIGTFPL